MVIDYASFTNAGEKERNEDTVRTFINEKHTVRGFVLADGLGGHGNGEIASRCVAESVGAAINGIDSISEGFIDQCFENSQKMLMEEKERTGYVSIKTTMVLLIINSSGIAQWGHIGDSRLYLFRSGKVLKRTLDHSVPQMLAISGQIKEKEIRRHPDRNILLRAMGTEWDLDSPIYEIGERKWKLQKGDVFLLCSDGFWEWIEEKSMAEQLRKYKSAREALLAMATKAKIAGTGQDMDNFSAILVKVSR
ncbi:MAG: protein phosphatase 2C domain-containing protein [Oscillospiraceae bacterium]|nr:protein phosphatase 2C domain-containing protein [Oscillospiraceae bacterium]